MLTKPVCTVCKRTLDRLPVEVTQSRLFRKQGTTVQLCATCDGPESKNGPGALERSLAEHRKRTYLGE